MSVRLYPTFATRAIPTVGGSVSASIPSAAALTLTGLAPTIPGSVFTTGFTQTENPLSGGGNWASPPAGSPQWTNMRTDSTISSGIAYGTNGANDTFDDSYAKFVGFSFPSPTNIEIVTTVYRNAGIPDLETHELELWFCIDDGSGFLRGYEVMLNYVGNTNMGKWLGGQTGGDIPVFPNQDSVGTVNDGDEFKARIVGNVLSMYFRGNLIYSNTDNNFGGVPAYTVGRPGIGAFKRPSGSNNVYGFKTVTIRGI